MGYGERARFMEGDGLGNGDEAWFEAERQRRVAAEEAAREREREEGELVRMRLEEREQREVRRRIMCDTASYYTRYIPFIPLYSRTYTYVHPLYMYIHHIYPSKHH